MKLTETFENGAKVISHQLNNTHSVTISMNFKIGSLYENDSNFGITHLIEHLFFRQWDKLSQDKLYPKMYSLGAEIKAETNYDYVRFSIKVIPAYFKKAFDLMAMCLNFFHWDDTAIHNEKAVVKSQINNDSFSYSDWINSVYFDGCKYENPIMGTVEIIDKLSSDEINAWKDKYFCIGNACIVITGNYSNDDLQYTKSIVKSMVGSPVNNQLSQILPVNFCKRNKLNRCKIQYDDSDSGEVVMFVDIDNTFDYETVRLLSSILDEGCGSILSVKMRETNNYTDDIYGELLSYSDFCRLSVSYTVENSELIKSLQCLFECIGKFKNHISVENYNSSIAFFTENQLMDLDDEELLNKRYALCEVALKNVLSAPQDLKQKYEAITITDLQNAAKKLFVKENISFLIQTSISETEIKDAILTI